MMDSCVSKRVDVSGISAPKEGLDTALLILREVRSIVYSMLYDRDPLGTFGFAHTNTFYHRELVETFKAAPGCKFYTFRPQGALPSGVPMEQPGMKAD